MTRKAYDATQLHELLYRALETELHGIKIYETALGCAVNDDLKKEWQVYLTQTCQRVDLLRDVFSALSLNPDMTASRRKVVNHTGASLVEAMEMAKADGNTSAAQAIARECVSLVESKDHKNWDLIRHLAREGKREETTLSGAANDDVGEDEEGHFCHAWEGTRELSMAALCLPAAVSVF